MVLVFILGILLYVRQWLMCWMHRPTRSRWWHKPFLIVVIIVFILVECKASVSALYILNSTGSAGFCVEYSTNGPIGIIEPAFTNRGIMSMGASTLHPVPLSIFSVQKSYLLSVAG